MDKIQRPTGTGLGILVLGYNRPQHLEAVLESLQRQNSFENTHIWIDGTHGRGEHLGANESSAEVAKKYPAKELRVIGGHLGIEKMMLDSLEVMSNQYDRVLVLEDDCFPLENSILMFEDALAEISGKTDMYSVYGHHFGTEPEDNRNFTRFQGWGWAAHSQQIRHYLPQLRELFLMNEQDYLHYIESHMTQDIKARLDRTSGRNVLGVLKQAFSWDSATSFVTARDCMNHRRTIKPAIRNTGIVAGIGHFRKDVPHLRKPPFNMITVDEAWDCYKPVSAQSNA